VLPGARKITIKPNRLRIIVKLARLPHEPAALVDFFQESLETLGALCDRTWFDRLQLVAEGRAAQLWNGDGALHEAELHFPAPDTTAPRDARRDVFPGCPLTFRLAEALRPQPPALERAILAPEGSVQKPDPAVAEKLWHVQRPGATRWRLEAPFAPTTHFSLLALFRCEIQAIDQHWSLHRLALSWPDGSRDDLLAASLDFARLSFEAASSAEWPAVTAGRCKEILSFALEEELADELGAIRSRQQNYLQRELDRVDDYFWKYEIELRHRVAHSHNANTKLKADQRLTAAKTEHARRRGDQIQRHEIRVIPHLDALLLLAEPAWKANVAVTESSQTQTLPALFVPRARKWLI
jgi:hypothetical protein